MVVRWIYANISNNFAVMWQMYVIERIEAHQMRIDYTNRTLLRVTDFFFVWLFLLCVGICNDDDWMIDEIVVLDISLSRLVLLLLLFFAWNNGCAVFVVHDLFMRQYEAIFMKWHHLCWTVCEQLFLFVQCAMCCWFLSFFLLGEFGKYFWEKLFILPHLLLLDNQ